MFEMEPRDLVVRRRRLGFAVLFEQLQIWSHLEMIENFEFLEFFSPPPEKRRSSRIVHGTCLKK